MSQSNVIASATRSSANVVPPHQADQPKKRRGGGPRGGIYDPFPLKWHRMLTLLKEEQGQDEVVSWLSHGRAFKVHQPKVFASTIMPRFFNQSKYTSFQRQLNLYGFSRCNRGPDTGAYHHPNFLRGKQSLARHIIRTKIKGCGHKTMRLVEAEPDFHAMAPLTADDCDDRSTITTTSLPTSVEQTASPNFPTSLAGYVSPDPSRSGDSIITKTDFPSSVEILSRQTSVGDSSATSGSSQGFVNDLNQSILMHELAMVCTTLCNLRKDTTAL